jgi:hypothetical protein
MTSQLPQSAIDQIKGIVKENPLDENVKQELQENLDPRLFKIYLEVLRLKHAHEGYCPLADVLAKDILVTCTTKQISTATEQKFVEWFKNVVLKTTQLGGSIGNAVETGCNILQIALVIFCIATLLLPCAAAMIISASGGDQKKSTKKPTQKRIKVGGKDRVVYEGPRGGEYIKQGGGFVSLKKL